jgi:nucleotide-binding universal stress UspA family protein
MIALAASGKGRVKEFIVGSTSLGVIRLSKLPVLLDKFPLVASDDPQGYCEKCPPLLDRVLVTIDLSKASKAMMPFVQQMIDAGAKKMTLFHVVQSSRYSMADDKRFREVKQKMEAYRTKLDAKDCEIDVHLHFGTTTYNILEAAREIDATLIVLGTTGKSYLRGATLGSTSEEVVKGSTRPLLLIPT